MKKYLDTSVKAVANKIAPLVAQVESPAFAAEMKQTEGVATGRSEVTAGTATKAATENRDIKAVQGKSSEVGAGRSSSGGASGAPSIDVGSSSLPASSSGPNPSRLPAAAKASASKALKSDLVLENADAFEIRKRLVRDKSYREELRNAGYEIIFADKVRFAGSK